MHSLSYRITTLAPVLISDSAGELNTVNTSSYIPGSTTLGVFANSYLQGHADALDKDGKAYRNDTFHAWFLSGALRFTNAYIIDSKKGIPYFPAPRSLHSEKNKGTIKTKEGRKLVDMLFEAPGEIEEQTKSLEGFLRFNEHNEKLVEKEGMKSSLNFHHARNAESGITEEGQIFNYESIDRGQTFGGKILGDATLLGQVLENFGNQRFTAYIGRSKSAQYGKVDIEILSKKPETFLSEIPDLNNNEPDFDETQISMTLLSDLILYNEQGFSSTDAALIGKELGVTIENAFLKTGTVENFVKVWDLPKPAETCLKAGSVLLLDISNSPKDRLLQAQREGLGERRSEGFGRVAFGWQRQDEGLDELRITKEKTKAPENIPMPKHTRHIVEETVRTFIRKQTQLQALQKAKEFTYHLPSKSLLGRVESLLKGASREVFLARLAKLRKTAADQLDACRSRSTTLRSFLQEHTISLQELAKHQTGLKEFAGEIGFSLEKNQEFAEELHELYFLTFFGSMRKHINKTEEGGD